ncbi:hypothetical protein D3C81_1301200 [compost metagenome]
MHRLAQHHRRVLRMKHHLHAGSDDLLFKRDEAFVQRRHQVHRFRVIVERSQRLQQLAHPFRHAIDLADDVVDVLLRRAGVELQRQFSAGTDGRQRIAQTVRHGGRHLAQGDKGFVGDQLFLLGREQNRRAPHDPVQAQINQPATQCGGQPDQNQSALHACDQILGLLVDFDHCCDVLALGVKQRNVVLDEDVVRWRDEFLFFAGLVDVVVAGGYRNLFVEGTIEVLVGMNAGTDQHRVG